VVVVVVVVLVMVVVVVCSCGSCVVVVLVMVVAVQAAMYCLCILYIIIYLLFIDRLGFLCRLQHVADAYYPPGTKTLVGESEAYTTKTCSWCHVLHDGVGGSKIFYCPHCGIAFDRDGNAAYNIWDRHSFLRRKDGPP